MQRALYADPSGLFVHDLVLQSCHQFADRTAIVDTSCDLRLLYAQYADIVEQLARGFRAAGLKPGEVLAIYLPNSWEFCAAYHAATLAGAIPTPLNPSYREREVRYQLENSEAAMLVTDATLIRDMNVRGLPRLRRVFSTREQGAGTEPFSNLLARSSEPSPPTAQSPSETLAALPYSSGTTGLPKGVMLSHANLVTNVFQFLIPGESATFTAEEAILCCLPLYHIYGLNVVLNPALTVGAKLVLMPRFEVAAVLDTVVREQITFMPLVPPMINALCQAVEQGRFPQEHRLRCVKSGAAPLAPELAHRFTELTGIKIRQGYGMTEASPVTHVGYLEDGLYRPESIGYPVGQTACRIIDENENRVAGGERGELVMRGPQFMLGYWKAPEATAAVLRDGWYRSGDVARTDELGMYYIVDRRKEMIKYKGFSVAPAEVESVLLEHPAVRDCGVVGRPDSVAGEVPCAFIVLREGNAASEKMRSEICGYVGERLTGYKQPREVRFVDAIPRTPSGKILRRELRKAL